MFFQSAGCCDGSAPLCLEAGELPVGPQDMQLGEVGGVPFYVGAEQYERLGKPQYVLDVSPGAADGFSLEGSLAVHFVTHTP